MSFNSVYKLQFFYITACAVVPAVVKANSQSTHAYTYIHKSFLYSAYRFNYKNKNWLQFLFIVKAAVLKQQISTFYPQIQRTEDSDHIYFSQWPFINVKAIFCA